MNRYGSQVKTYWSQWLPNRYQALENPEAFFTSVGEQIEEAILQISGAWESRERETLNAMDYLSRVGRLNAIEASAREMAMAEWLPEPEAQQEEEMEDSSTSPTLEWADKDGMPLDHQHPLWAMLEDDSVSTQDYLKAAREWRQEQENLHQI